MDEYGRPGLASASRTMQAVEVVHVRRREVFVDRHPKALLDLAGLDDDLLGERRQPAGDVQVGVIKRPVWRCLIELIAGKRVPDADSLEHLARHRVGQIFPWCSSPPGPSARLYRSLFLSSILAIGESLATRGLDSSEVAPIRQHPPDPVPHPPPAPWRSSRHRAPDYAVSGWARASRSFGLLSPLHRSLRTTVAMLLSPPAYPSSMQATPHLQSYPTITRAINQNSWGDKSQESQDQAQTE